MARPRGSAAGQNGKYVGFRLSDGHLKRLANIRKCGDFSDDSVAMRWCIDFTATMLRLIPAAVAETYISSFTEPEGTTAASAAAPGVMPDSDVAVPWVEPGGTTAFYPAEPF